MRSAFRIGAVLASVLAFGVVVLFAVGASRTREQVDWNWAYLMLGLFLITGAPGTVLTVLNRAPKSAFGLAISFWLIIAVAIAVLAISARRMGGLP